ncbi:Retinol dehydrogenase 11 [Nymphon striatum]|nr:Retinol dehydrogenase 11 [Nymphon striatum]
MLTLLLNYFKKNNYLHNDVFIFTLPIAEVVNMPTASIKDVRLDGKVVIITGANTGIGKETAKDLAIRGAKVILACRDLEKAKKSVDDLTKDSNLNAENFAIHKLDLASLNSVRQFATEILKEYENIHILINNAGIMMCPEWKTEDGFEMQFGVNHLGHVLLTNLLLERIKKSAPSRIVIVSSLAHKYGKINFDDLNMEKGYSAGKAYSQSKLANILFAKELASRLEGTGVSVFSLHPGVIATELNRHIGSSINRFIGWAYQKMSFFLKTPAQGAQTTIYCSVAEGLEEKSGCYFRYCSSN